MADPRHETDTTLALLDRWLVELESTTSALRAEIDRLAQEGVPDASADSDGER